MIHAFSILTYAMMLQHGCLPWPKTHMPQMCLSYVLLKPLMSPNQSLPGGRWEQTWMRKPQSMGNQNQMAAMLCIPGT